MFLLALNITFAKKKICKNSAIESANETNLISKVQNQVVLKVVQQVFLLLKRALNSTSKRYLRRCQKTYQNITPQKVPKTAQ